MNAITGFLFQLYGYCLLLLILKMIRPRHCWQQAMVGNKLNHDFFHNISAVSEEIKYWLSDVVVIISGLSFITLLYFKQFLKAGIITAFTVFIFLLIFNAAYWLLPFSELLYPERVVYFMVVSVAFYFGYSLTVLDARGIHFVFSGAAYPFIVV